MSNNVISLSQHFRPKASGLSTLAHRFSSQRRDQNDVFWLKENAEFLSILECTGQSIDHVDLEKYAAFYQSLADHIAFFPQYYRFQTSIALDLEALGLEGTTAEQLCVFVAEQGLAENELSDLQRGEAMRLLARKGIKISGEAALRDRLHAFMDQSANFAVPNRKIAYELTHIVFYLSEYGRKDPELSEKAVQSLMFTGILAHLEENADLLSEVCVALRYAGRVPPKAWETWIAGVVSGFDRSAATAPVAQDSYHEFLVANWAIAAMGKTPFSGAYGDVEQGFVSPVATLGAMRSVSEALFEMRAPRHRSWDVMQGQLMHALSDDVAQHLENVIVSCPDFAAFFEHFARPALPNMRKQQRQTSSRLELAQ